MNNKIKVLFLDIDNTLLDFDAGAAWGDGAVLSEGRTGSTVRKCLLFLQRKIIRSGSRIERRGTDDGRPLLCALAGGASDISDWTADGVEMEKEFRRLLHLSAVPVEGAKDILEYLYKKKYLPLRSEQRSL